MKNTKSSYTNFHLLHSSEHIYPTEWVIRTMLGKYPKLRLDRSNYNGGKILDLGFGDGRNWRLLNNCRLRIYGVEITEATINLGKKTAKNLNLEVSFKIGTSDNIPFTDNYFDYLLASSSCYYCDENTTFGDNLREITRVLKPNGYFIGNFPAYFQDINIPKSFILEDAIEIDDGHIIIQNDIYGLRNGYKFRVFSSEEEILEVFNQKFEDISIGKCMDNFYGVQINSFIVTAKKK